MTKFEQVIREREKELKDIDALYLKIKARWNLRRQKTDATVEELKFLVELLDEMERDDFAKDITEPPKGEDTE